MDDLDIAKDRADWLLDAIAGATQNRQFLRGDPAYDEVAGKAILLNGEKAINVALSKKDAEITRLRAALADAQTVGFAAGVEAVAKEIEGDDYNIGLAMSMAICCSGHECGCMGASVSDYLVYNIRALTPTDATAAAARVLLDDMGKSPADHLDAVARWGKANEVMGRDAGAWRALRTGLRAIAGDTP